MAFTFVWDIAFKTAPSDSEVVSLGASRIRDLKSAITERIEVDHSLAGDANDGAHLKTTLLQQGADPTTATTTGFVYTKNVAGATELFYKDAAGNVVQITSGGKIPDSAIANTTLVPAGSRTAWNQTTAPVGWTKDTSAALNDTAMRIVTGTVGSGGSVALSGAAYTPTISIGTLAVGAHALTTAELPNLQYQIYAPTANAGSNGGSISSFGTASISPAWTNVPQTAAIGSFRDTNGNGSHAHSFTGTPTSSTITLDLKYNDFIIASKN